ncbi:exonuclease subunit SbcD [Paracidovorax avenae]|uniref:exonuclease subunit SbcD n=1 Tax=Paracidovorax avenae TaxID=80867 RepID=UPI000D20CBDC|nr:exonuclease subunit SbcD [Paracidovorax avenae]AVS78051.1 exonuclease subunit SbcD [Paracidovorax avenae]
MRLLHTSDWHLGQHFMGKSRQAEHRAFIDWLAAQAADCQADAVLLAGDVFDTSAPPSHARELYHHAVLSLREAGTALVVLGGNHDSAAVLGESRALLAELGTRVVPCAAATPAEQVLVLQRRSGGPGAVLCAVPYLRPRELLLSLPGESAADKRMALQQAIRAHYAALFDMARERSASLGGLPIVATGHLATVGATGGDAVRDIYVGTLEAFPTDAFPAADYIALGHIHQPMKVGGHEHIRYCGSPIPLGFDEAAQRKEVLQVDFDLAGLQSVAPLPVPCFQPMASLRGSLATLPAALTAAARAGTQETPAWLDVEVAGDDYLPDLQARVAAMADGLPVEVLRVRRARGGAAPALVPIARETLDELAPGDVFERRLREETLDEALRERLAAMHRGVLSDLQEEGAA